jgi:hypothetical protein
MPGWQETTAGARSWADLPAQAIKYIQRVEELIETPVALVRFFIVAVAGLPLTLGGWDLLRGAQHSVCSYGQREHHVMVYEAKAGNTVLVDRQKMRAEAEQFYNRPPDGRFVMILWIWMLLYFVAPLIPPSPKHK